jgi:hypothetical protein
MDARVIRAKYHDGISLSIRHLRECFAWMLFAATIVFWMSRPERQNKLKTRNTK